MSKITIDREVLEQALDALEQRYSDLLYDYAGPHHAMAFEESIAALREALAQQSSRQVEEIPSTVLEQPQLVPVYQYQYANGSWADQTKESYDYNVRNGWATVRVLFTSLQAAPPEPQPEHPQPDRQSVPESLSDYELSELAHSANQEALSYGLSHDVFMRYFKTLRDKALAAAPQPQPVQREPIGVVVAIR